MTDGERSRKYAAVKLDELARCTRIAFFQAGDELEVCSNDFVPLVSTGRGWIHDPAFIARLREAAMEGVWPRG